MPLSMMQPLSRPPSRDIETRPSGPTRRLSREVTYQLADTARRKSSDKIVREDLRLKLSHDHLLEMLLQDIARTERELQTSPTHDKYSMEQERKFSPRGEEQQQRRRSSGPGCSPQYDEYGFPLEEEGDGEEDLGGLSLMRTESKRPRR
ncbi:hypothetical protein LTR99_008734 [Exophiala xenobiotica]|uniref:Uncharacterized protein n=1 Tax=Vermiconidia calcicola TaxID=1690605 RepID=A0AAV9Q3U3_9PEZI|nr:hypothetical protein LTR96_009004 [Exophiala xenobiotica]KAK5533378.1 hypothetical protein LTR25_007244 [Vermiconidia calcicola]KAK5542840.1 hypothetical protein LTR23_005165 [Chaetothyriales sp. CCFEE 6169]KAK5296367.1 hypothetical protein LTR99_008734 [Exophiala xenobiotica]KAK5334420.1 hypothetical protein LTR98_009374 [Exophiala xenobiotica]